MKQKAEDLIKEINQFRDNKKAKKTSQFFKTGKGEYSEGDKFIGVSVPICRKIAKKYSNLELQQIIKLLKSPIHEIRQTSLFILTCQYQKGDWQKKQTIYHIYLENIQYINNWDLVDLSAHKIVGDYLIDKNKDVLYQLAKSENLWQKRIAVIATFAFIKKKKYQPGLKISQMLLNDQHDLIHKAIGWMLREIGKQDFKIENRFLKKYYKKMPRTMLRYAIEKFPEKLRQKYLKSKL